MELEKRLEEPIMAIRAWAEGDRENRSVFMVTYDKAERGASAVAVLGSAENVVRALALNAYGTQAMAHLLRTAVAALDFIKDKEEAKEAEATEASCN